MPVRLNAFYGQAPVLEELGHLSRRLRDSVLGAAPIALWKGIRHLHFMRVDCVMEGRKRMERLGRNDGPVHGLMVRQALRVLTSSRAC